jgi:hypothetical protein
MRLLGLALFTLLLMGLIQFALWTDRDTTSRVVGSLSLAERVVHDFASDVTQGTRDTHLGDRHHVIVVREADTWGALSGSPGYHRARFNLPRDMRSEEGTLTLDLSAQLQDEGVARLMVNVNGQRRGELVLPEGKSEHRITLNLLPSDLTQSVLEVNLAAHGRFPQANCTARWNGGMVVRVEPTSHVSLKTEAPLVSLDDRMRASGDPARLVWSDGMAAQTMARLLRFGVHETAQGSVMTFVAPAAQNGGVTLDPADLTTADARVETAPAPVLGSWPMELADGTQLGEAKFFEFRTQWRVPYDLRSTPDGTLPTHFDLDLSLLGLNEAERWMLSVVLNGRAIHTERLASDVERLARSVPLPSELQGFANVLEVHLMNAEPRSGLECLSGVPVMAQLETGTRLRGGAAPADPDVAAFSAALPEDLALVVASRLNAAEATSAMQFLTEAFGRSTSWTPAEAVDLSGPGTAQVIWRHALPEAVAQARAAGDRDLWALWPRLGSDTDAPYALVRITPQTDLMALVRAEGGRIAALVSLPRAPRSGVSLQTSQVAPTPVTPPASGRTAPTVLSQSLAQPAPPAAHIHLQPPVSVFRASLRVPRPDALVATVDVPIDVPNLRAQVADPAPARVTSDAPHQSPRPVSRPVRASSQASALPAPLTRAIVEASNGSRLSPVPRQTAPISVPQLRGDLSGPGVLSGPVVY